MPTRYRWDPVREAQRAARLAAQAAKEEQQLLHRRRADETTNLNERLNTRVQELRHILEHALNTRLLVSFEHLRVKETFRPFQTPPQLAQETKRIDRAAFFAHLKPPGWLDKLIPGEKKKFEQQRLEAESRYYQAVKWYEDTEASRKAKLASLRAEYDRAYQNYQRRVQESNSEIERLEASYAALEAEYDEGKPPRSRRTSL